MKTPATNEGTTGAGVPIELEADSPEALYQRASLLAEFGAIEGAKQNYLAVIARAPTHFGALNDLGTLLYNTDFRSAARLAYAEAVKHHPDNPIGQINLANALLANGQTMEARAHYEAALQLSPDHPDAHQGLANLLQEQGQAEEAEQHRQLSYRARGVTTLPYRGEGAGCRVLLLVSAVGGNVPTRFLLDDSVFATSVLAAEAHHLAMPLPGHDLVFNAVGDADLCAASLTSVEAVLERTSAPAINPPARVRATGRLDNARNLAGLEGVRAPRIVLASRDGLQRAAAAFDFPLLLRSPGYHTGRNFLKVDRACDLAGAAEQLSGDDLLLIEYLDARDRHGRARKFRVMFIDGRPYPLHLAISEDWKVHYFTADMLDRPAHRAEEQAFLVDMAAVLGPRAVTALKLIGERLGLDYAGVDFGLGPHDELLLFEANATMVVNPPDPDPRWDYRRGPVDAVLAATQTMLLQRARGPNPATLADQISWR